MTLFSCLLSACVADYIHNNNSKFSPKYRVVDSVKTFPTYLLGYFDTTSMTSNTIRTENISIMSYSLKNHLLVSFFFLKEKNVFVRSELDERKHIRINYHYNKKGEILYTQMRYNPSLNALIGKSYYFDENKNIQKVINYDTIYPICWKEAIKLAKKYGLKGDNFYMRIKYPEDGKPRQGTWTLENEKVLIRINAQTGELTQMIPQNKK